MTLDVDTAKKILSNVDKKHVFKLKKGHIIHNLTDLYEELQKISPEDFKHHVEKDKNDFANWVEECVGDKHLADSLKETADLDKTVDKVKSRLFILKLMTVLKEDFEDKKIDEEEEKEVEKMFEKEIEQIEKDAKEDADKELSDAKDELKKAKAELKKSKHHLPRHDMSNLNGEKEALAEIKDYIKEMEKNEEKIVEELANLEEENKGLQKLFTKNFLHGFLLGLASGILIVILALKLVLMNSGA